MFMKTFDAVRVMREARRELEKEIDDLSVKERIAFFQSKHPEPPQEEGKKGLFGLFRRSGN